VLGLQFLFEVLKGHAFAYGGVDQVAIITPFNFPLEIPVLQVLGALFMGNKPLLKVDSKVVAFPSL
jgi:delta 1-pyrroline-5-carboxylate dehydrogenase